MSVIDTADATTPGAVRGRDDRHVFLATGLLLTCVVGTNAGFHCAPESGSGVSSVTAGRTSLVVPSRMTAAEEVATARDELVRLGLTRQQIARAVGVDRRSLSGWASGDIRPTPERLAALRVLIDIAVVIDAAHPGRTAEILMQRRGGTDLLDHLARGRVDVVQNWEAWALRRPSRVTVTTRRIDGEPLWAAAARAMAAGQLQPLERARSVRDESAYRMDLDEAAVFEEHSAEEPRRGSYG